MFSAGQMVYHKAGKHSGKVLEHDGDTVYVLQANGVEIEFRSHELTTTAPQTKTRETEVSDRLNRTLTPDDITPDHRRVLSVIPQRTMQSIALLFERKRTNGRFSALDVAQKLNFIAEVTEVPYRTMKEFSDSPGTLGLMMGRGIAARTNPAK